MHLSLHLSPRHPPAAAGSGPLWGSCSPLRLPSQSHRQHPRPAVRLTRPVRISAAGQVSWQVGGSWGWWGLRVNAYNLGPLEACLGRQLNHWQLSKAQARQQQPAPPFSTRAPRPALALALCRVLPRRQSHQRCRQSRRCLALPRLPARRRLAVVGRAGRSGCSAWRQQRRAPRCVFGW